MQPDTTDQIRLRPDGSIDIEHYLNLGRQARADQARKMTRSLGSKPHYLSHWVRPLTRAFR